MSRINLDGRVAIITGAGGGLGREYALELAQRGAKIVVNDLGGSVGGEGASDAADLVVDEIRAAGGQAIANGASVTDASAMEVMAQQAIKAFGRIDILVANAGILRDRTFAKMSAEDFDAVVGVHLLGTARSIKAVWETMRTANFGRIVVTTSTAGLMGNLGQSNYGAAKMGIVGLMNSLKIEGQKYGIRVNVISPFAVTRMSEGLVPPEIADAMNPRFVAPGVTFLVSDDAPTGVILNAGGGVFSTARLTETQGITIDRTTASAEDIRDRWTEISDTAGEHYHFSALEHSTLLMPRILTGA